jgi:hypothetical protein
MNFFGVLRLRLAQKNAPDSAQDDASFLNELKQSPMEYVDTP